jgi:hypothetical protein
MSHHRTRWRSLIIAFHAVATATLGEPKPAKAARVDASSRKAMGAAMPLVRPVSKPVRPAVVPPVVERRAA